MKKYWSQIHSFWPWLLAFAAIWCALRLFWITCDTGIPATWEFGFHTTDEGYYLCGGKEMYLWGSFVDLSRQEALNYCYSFGTHWLSYLAHLCFGLSTWSWRIPFSLLYLTGWLLMFRYVAKHACAWFAFVTCVVASSVPLVITYERGFSNDATIAALVAIAFSLAAGKGTWRIFAAALATSAIATVKPAVWVMMPVVLSSILEDRKTHSRLLDAALFIGVTTGLVYVWKGISALTVLNVAHASGLTPWQVLAAVNATYGLPSILDLAQDFRALASFPRDPSIKTMGPTIVLISVVPAAMFLTNIIRRKWNGHLLFYLMIPLYALALNVINSMYTHYFLPLLILLPALTAIIHKDFSDRATEKISWRFIFTTASLITAALAVAMIFLISARFTIQEAAPLYARIHNLPQENPWRMTWPILAAGTFVGTATIAAFRGIKAFCRESWAWGLIFFLIISIALAALPAAIIAPRIHQDAASFYWPIAINLITGSLFAFLLFVRPAAFARPIFACALLVVPITVAYVLIPSWRNAAGELITRHTHYDAFFAKELGKLLPKNAVVLGERSDQALMSLPVRPISTFLTASNPIPYVERILKEKPDTPIYALVDSQCSYNLQHFKEHAKEYQLDLVKAFKMPSFGDGKLADVYLCKVRKLSR